MIKGKQQKNISFSKDASKKKEKGLKTKKKNDSSTNEETKILESATEIDDVKAIKTQDKEIDDSPEQKDKVED